MDEERRSHWSFVIGESGAWSWRVLHPDCSATLSPSTFDTLKACVADAALNGYVLPPEQHDRRRERRAPPSVMVAQEVRCPTCRNSWDLQRHRFVVSGDLLLCRHGCGGFYADATTVSCCIEQADGLVQLPLPSPR